MSTTVGCDPQRASLLCPRSERRLGFFKCKVQAIRCRAIFRQLHSMTGRKVLIVVAALWSNEGMLSELCKLGAGQFPQGCVLANCGSIHRFCSHPRETSVRDGNAWADNLSNKDGSVQWSAVA